MKFDYDEAEFYRTVQWQNCSVCGHPGGLHRKEFCIGWRSDEPCACTTFDPLPLDSGREDVA